MADVKFEVTVADLATSGPTQDVTITGFGTPKTAIFIWTEAETDDTIKANLRFGTGVTDGTREWANNIGGEDAQGTTDTERGTRSDAVVAVDSLTGTGLIGRYSFNSWITDGIRINVDTALSTSKRCTVILIGGADVTNVYCNYYDDLGTGTSAIDITAPGFEPDLLFLSTIGLASPPNDDNNNQAIFGFGVAHNDASDTQRGTYFSSRNSNAFAQSTAYISNMAGIGKAHNGVLNWEGVIGSFDSSGFSITPSASSGNNVFYYLALKFSNSPDISLFDLTIPTSGNYAETNPGFEPSFGFVSCIQGPSARNTITTSSCFANAIAAFDSNGIYTATTTEEDAATTTVSKSLHSDQFRILDYQGSANAAVASSYAFDSQGWDFTLSTNPASAILGWGLAIGAGGGGGGGATEIPPRLHNLDNQFATIIAHRLNGHLQ